MQPAEAILICREPCVRFSSAAVGGAVYSGLVLELSSLDLEEIGNALADQNGYEHRWLINPQTGQIAFWTADTGIDGQTPSISTIWTWSASIRCHPGSGTRTWPTSPMG